jgi:phosphoribosylcarboxyaminoimidazole (NCAIR) mutase
MILMGSQNDAPVMQGAVDVLRTLGISVEMTVASAHRLAGASAAAH